MLNTIFARLFFYKLVLGAWISGFFSSKVYAHFLKYSSISKKRVRVGLVKKKKIFFRGVFKGINLENINKFNLLWKNIFVITQLLEQQQQLVNKDVKDKLVNEKKKYVENI